MKKLVFSLLGILCFTQLFAQQDFKTGYKFGKINNTNGSFKIYRQTDQKNADGTTKFVECPFTIQNFNYSGIIKKISEEGKGDTLFIKLWPIFL